MGEVVERSRATVHDGVCEVEPAGAKLHSSETHGAAFELGAGEPDPGSVDQRPVEEEGVSDESCRVEVDVAVAQVYAREVAAIEKTAPSKRKL
jgi:hypothetical protein